MTPPSPPADAGPSRSRLPLRAMTAFLAVLSVLALIVIVLEVTVLRPRHDEVTQRKADRSEVIALAQSFVVQWNTFDSGDLDTYRDGVAGLLSTKFRTEFEDQFTDVAQIVTASEMTSAGTVLKSGVASLDNDSAQVLVVADADVSTSVDDRKRHFRWQVDLVKVAGEWKVDDWEPVQQTAAVAP